MLSESPSVPWTGLDVFLIFVLWFAAQVTCSLAVDVIDSHPPTPVVTAENTDNGHPLAQMIEQAKNSPIILLTAFLAAVVVAPIFEEFLFRMLLQGWFEAKLLQYHFPRASGTAIIAVSLFFAAIHSGNSSSWDVHVLVFLSGLSIIMNLLVLLFGIAHLIRMRQVPIRRYFFGTEPFFSPQFFAVSGYCLLALFLIYGLTLALGIVYPHTNIRPIPIFFFSLLLGTLYCKTQNLSYSILLHACLNGTSFTLAWLGTFVNES